MRRRVLAGLAAVVAVLVAGYGFSWWQTHSARDDLAGAQGQGTTLNAETARYAPLVLAQGQTAAIHAQLAQLMTGDLSWRQMLTTPAGPGPGRDGPHAGHRFGDHRQQPDRSAHQRVLAQ